jgi:hypothetical protein
MAAEIPPEAVRAAMARRADLLADRPDPMVLSDETLTGKMLEAAAPLLAGEPVTEHADLMSGGGYHVWNTEPYIEEIYPLAQKIEDSQRFGGKVYRRRVVVVEDWEEVPGEH